MKLRLTNCITIMCSALLGCTDPSPRRPARNNAAAKGPNAREEPSAPSSAQELAGKKESPKDFKGRMKSAKAA